MARVYKRGDRSKDRFYYADYIDAHGQRHRERVSPNKRHAEEYLARKLAEAAERKLLPHRLVGEKTFAEFAEYYLAHYAPTLGWRDDVKRMLRAWMKHLGDVRLREITPAMIQARLTERRQSVKPSTTNRDRSVIHRVLTLAVQHGELDRNPCQACRPLSERNARSRYLSVEEANALVAVCSGVLRAVVLVGLNSGARKSELVDLKWRDVDFASKTLTFTQTKNGSLRRVPMNDTVVHTLKRLRRYGEFVFMEDGRRVRHIYKPFKVACRRAGLADVTLHTMRHTFISHALMAGIDPRTVAHIVGHKTLTMVMRYAHVAPSHATRAVDRVRLGEPDRVEDAVVPFGRVASRRGPGRRTAGA